MSVPADIIRKFQNSSFLKMHLSALCGFIAGAKVCDLIFFNDEKYETVREEMENEFWQRNGEPTEIPPYIVPSRLPGKEGQMRKSWIYIMFEKDKLIKKKDDLDK